MVSTECSDLWVLEFVVSNTTGNNQWENCISLDFNGGMVISLDMDVDVDLNSTVTVIMSVN
jgi:hypothetical protein